MWSTPSTTSSVTLGRLARKRLIRSSRTSSPPAATAIDPESEVTSIRWIGSVNVAVVVSMVSGSTHRPHAQKPAPISAAAATRARIGISSPANAALTEGGRVSVGGATSVDGAGGMRTSFDMSGLQVSKDGEHPAMVAGRGRQVELGEDVADVLLDGTGTDGERLGDRVVGASLGH